MRLHRSAVAVLLIFVLSCGGGGGSSPTEPPPAPGDPVALQGSWSGNITVTAPADAATTCTVHLTLDFDGQAYFGNWEAQCANGTQGQGITAAFLVPFSSALVSGLSSPAVFGGCGWGSVARREGNRLRGNDWSTTENCATGPVLRGRIELTKQ